VEHNIDTERFRCSCGKRMCFKCGGCSSECDCAKVFRVEVRHGSAVQVVRVVANHQEQAEREGLLSLGLSYANVDTILTQAETRE